LNENLDENNNTEAEECKENLLEDISLQENIKLPIAKKIKNMYYIKIL